jgi:hypothetical protein
MSNRGKIVVAVAVLLALCIGAVTWRALQNPTPLSGSSPTASVAASASTSSAPAVVRTEPVASTSAAAESFDAPFAPSNAAALPNEGIAKNVAAQNENPPQVQKDESEPLQPQASASVSATAVASAQPVASAVASEVADAQPPAAAVAQPAATVAPTGQALGRFRNNVSNAYRLVSVTCSIDGAATFVTSGSATDARLFDRRLPPGQHTFSVVAEFQGQGGGVFSYVEGYHFKVQGGRPFTVRSNETTQIGVTAYERGGPTTKFEERLAIAVDVR